MKTNYSRLRAYYQFKDNFSVGMCIFPFVRKRLKKQLSKKQVCEMVRTAEGFLVPVDSFNKETRYIQIKGSIDNELNWIIKRYVKRGSLSIDVGSNLGFISLLMAEAAGEAGKVVSIEPNADLNEYFHNLMHVNRLDNVALLNCVCGDENKETGFSVNKNDHKKSKIDNHSDNYVQSVTIDKILENEGKRVSFIKIDVEGFEDKVFKGAMHTIRKHRPTLVFETGWLHSEENIEKINVALRTLEYEVIGVIHDWGVEPRSLTLGMTDKTHCNVLALPEKRSHGY